MDEAQTDSSSYEEKADDAPKELDPRSTVRFWYDWLDDTEEAGKVHQKRADAAYRDYDLETLEVNGEAKEKKEGGFAIYYSTSKHLEAAYYSQTPKMNSIRRFGIDDDEANTQALITERLGTFFVESDDYDAVIEKAVQDFVHADKASVQVVTEDTEPEVIETPVLMVAGPDGQRAAVTQEGEPVPPEELSQDAAGRPVRRQEDHNPKISLLPVAYDEIRHSPNARVESEIKEKAFLITLDEYEVKDRFYSDEENSPKIKFDSLPWLTAKTEEDDPEEEPVKRLKIWEIVCETSNKIYWLTDQRVNEFLDVAENEDGLRGTFPCTPFIISNTPKKGMYPTPAHTHIKPYLDALDELWFRIVDLIPKIERKAIMDEKLAEALDALDGDLDWVTVKNLAQMIEGTGDLRGMIQFLPLQELVQAIQEASGLIDVISRWYNEHIGLPDILRGQADPNNAMETNRTMAQAAHDRFKKQKRKVQKMCRDAIELCIDMALAKWSDRKIWEVTGFQYAEPEHQQRFTSALQSLRDDDQRFIRIAIETDSTSFADEAAEAQQAQALSQVITQGLATIGGAQNQEYVPILLEMLLITVEHMGGSEKHADDIKQAVADLQEKKKGEEGQEQGDPAEAMKGQVEQFKAQLQAQKLQMDAQATTRELDLKEMKMQMDAQREAAEFQLKQQEANMERTVAAFEMQAKQQELEIERFKAHAQAQESQLEEIRLAKDHDINELKTVIEVMKEETVPAPAPQTPQLPPMNFHIDASKATAKRGVMMRPNGEKIEFMTEDVAEPQNAE